MVRAFKDIAESVPRERLETVSKADCILCKDVCHAGRLWVVHPNLRPLHGRAKFREEYAALAFEVLVHPCIERVCVLSDFKACLEHVLGVQVFGCPVRISVQVNDIEVSFAIGLFGFADNAQEFCHPVFAIVEACAFL